MSSIKKRKKHVRETQELIPGFFALVFGFFAFLVSVFGYTGMPGVFPAFMPVFPIEAEVVIDFINLFLGILMVGLITFLSAGFGHAIGQFVDRCTRRARREFRKDAPKILTNKELRESLEKEDK